MNGLRCRVTMRWLAVTGLCFSTTVAADLAKRGDSPHLFSVHIHSRG